MYKLHRVTNSIEDGCFGVLSFNDLPLCVTLEETWLNNKKQISCIPAGMYEVEKYSGTKYKNVWIVKNVPQRSAILIHWGNTEENTAGCILVGKEYGKFGTKTGILRSVQAIEELRKILPNKFNLEIINCF